MNADTPITGFRWESVDWVELGCRGWDIEPEGAELDGRAHGGTDMDGAHLCGVTGHLMVFGSPDFVEQVVGDLRAARVPGYGPYWTTTATDITTAATSSGPHVIQLYRAAS